MQSHAVILLAHGSRDALWRRPVEAVQARVQSRRPDVMVRCAYLELCAPALDAVVQDLVAAPELQSIVVVPLFLGAGRHVREDLPHMVESLAKLHPRLRIRLVPPVGEDDRMVELMAGIALEAVP